MRPSMQVISEIAHRIRSSIDDSRCDDVELRERVEKACDPHYWFLAERVTQLVRRANQLIEAE